MTNYFRIILGKQNMYVEECFKNNFIGVDFAIDYDLSSDLTEDWKEFNQKFIPIYQKNRPDKTKVSAGLACGALWTVSKGISIGDIVLCPNGMGEYLVGEVISEYSYHGRQTLPHRRSIKWNSQTIEKSRMSLPLKNSSGSIGTVSNITKYASELELLITNENSIKIYSTDDTIEDPTVFALEKHLEEFLVSNWKNTELGKNYNIFEEEGEIVGQQFPTDTGCIDILAVSKDKKEILVVELKKGRASDSVVGQIQRYMGYVTEELAEKNQTVKGLIIALDDDNRIKRALSVAKNIDFYRYQVTFKLSKS